MHIRQSIILLLIINLVALNSGCISVAVYTKLAINPDKIKHELKHQEENYQVVINGTYLGKTKISGQDYYHLQFPEILKGEGRGVHIYLNCLNPEKAGLDSNGFLVEDKLVDTPEAKQSLLFYNYHPYHYKNVASVKMSKQNLNVDAINEYPPYIFSGVNKSRGIFFCYPPNEWSNRIKYWECDVDFARVERSTAMLFVRPIYTYPAVIMCIPIDIVMFIYTISWEMIICPRRPEAFTHGYWAERIASDDECF